MLELCMLLSSSSSSSISSSTSITREDVMGISVRAIPMTIQLTSNTKRLLNCGHQTMPPADWNRKQKEQTPNQVSSTCQEAWTDVGLVLLIFHLNVEHLVAAKRSIWD